MKPPRLIGIAGCSASGKTRLARVLCDRLPAARVPLDAYYREVFKRDLAGEVLAGVQASERMPMVPLVEGYVMAQMEAPGSFLGRSELNDRRSASSVSGLHVSGGATRSQPYVDLDPSRKDFFDATLGLRVRLHETLTFNIGFFRALNDDGARSSEFSGVGAFETTF